MSSAETELAAMVEACKELLFWVLARYLEEWDPVGSLFEDGALYGLAVRPEHHGHVWTSPPGEARGVGLCVPPTPGAAEAS